MIFSLAKLKLGLTKFDIKRYVLGQKLGLVYRLKGIQKNGRRV
jgi:hypothetical protein